MNIIKNYLQNNPLHYDFTDDCTYSADYQMKKGLEKFFIYRSPQPTGKEIFPIAASVIERNFELYGSIGDPDSASSLLQKIYSLLWPEIKEQKKEYMLSKCGWICSDTMTSVQTTLNAFIGNKMPEVLKQYGVKKVSSKMCIELYESNASFRKLLENNENLLRFIADYHTCGNLIPVPYGFNVARSGYFGSHDYWDLTLMKIKEYYDTKTVFDGFGDSFMNPAIKIMELLHCSNEVICCCRWLNSFVGWEDFICRNFLQDFVNEDNQPVPLCTGHSWDCTQILDFDEFFKNCWQCIEKRSIRIIERLRKMI